VGARKKKLIRAEELGGGRMETRSNWGSPVGSTGEIRERGGGRLGFSEKSALEVKSSEGGNA